MTYTEKAEFNLALEDLMDKIEKYSLTDEQWDEIAAVYYTAKDWNDYWRLDGLFKSYI